MTGTLRSFSENLTARPLSSLPSLSAILEDTPAPVEWNATQAFYPENQTITRIFELQVERTPDAIAFLFGNQHITYHELNARSNQLAHYIHRLGVTSESRVALCLERSLEMIVALLAILKTGATYVPLDPAYPTDRLAFMLTDSEPLVLLTEQSLLGRLPLHPQTLYLDTLQSSLAQESSENILSDATSEHPAYVMYTSGSTGQPRGVLGTHRAAINRFYWMWTAYPFAATDRCCQKTALSFVDSVWEIFGPLLQGIPSVILPDASVKNSHLLLQALSLSSITRIVLVPSLLQALLDAAPNLDTLLPNLRYCISSGESLPLKLAQRFLQSLPHCTLLNLYGSSEVAADATCYNVSQEPSLNRMLIGRPISNTQIYLLDEQMQPVSIGMAGEIYIGGANVALGYFQRPELTEAKFLPDPFSQEPGARLYKTGDQARYLPDGNIEYLGRLDHQLKIRGVRIEPAEIEAVLMQHPAVRSAVVLAHAFAEDDTRLLAYLVFHQGEHALLGDLRSLLLKELPLSMLPAIFFSLPSLPLTPNGKVDRHALPAPDTLNPLTEDLSDAPLSPLHQQLRQIWEELLSVRPIGIHDNFFYIGGHSLLATRLVAQIELAFGKKLSLATLFAGPSIDQIAHALENEARSSRTPLVAVQSSGQLRPFFYLHGAWNSDAFYCFHLAQYLGKDQPFYALAPYDFTNLDVMPTIEEMATAHIQSIRSIQPEGPYLLGGFCNGGVVAYEMARQLVAAGELVENLVLIDPAYSPPSHSLPHVVLSSLGKLFHLNQKLQVESFLRIRHLYKYARHQNTFENIKTSRNIDPRILRLNPPSDILFLDDNALLDWIIAGYSYPLYTGSIQLIWAEKEPFPNPWLRKTQQESSIHLQIIPGTHIGCRTDHVQSLAKALARALASGK